MAKKKKTSATIQVTLPLPLYDRVTELAKAAGMTRAGYVRHILTIAK
jgi:predicted DNA-binding protein